MKITICGMVAAFVVLTLGREAGAQVAGGAADGPASGDQRLLWGEGDG